MSSFLLFMSSSSPLIHKYIILLHRSVCGHSKPLCLQRNCKEENYQPSRVKVALCFILSYICCFVQVPTHQVWILFSRIKHSCEWLLKAIGAQCRRKTSTCRKSTDYRKSLPTFPCPITTELLFNHKCISVLAGNYWPPHSLMAVVNWWYASFT